jgi:hypothetical protein
MKQKCRNTDQENIYNSGFNLHELTQAIVSLKTKKSPGPGSITAGFLKHLYPLELDTCLWVFHHIWKTLVLALWRNTESQNISFSTVHLLTDVLKSMEKVVTVRLNWYLEIQMCHLHHNQPSGYTAQQISKLLCLVCKLRIFLTEMKQCLQSLLTSRVLMILFGG